MGPTGASNSESTLLCGNRRINRLNRNLDKAGSIVVGFRYPGDSRATGFDRQDVMSESLFVDVREAAGCHLHLSLVAAAVCRQLRVAIGAEKTEVPRAIVSVDAVVVIENWPESRIVPPKWVGVKMAIRIVAPLLR